MPTRTFVALDLPDASRALLADACTELREVAPAWAGEKWVAPELLHVTIKFIGVLPDPSLARVLEALLEECGRHAPLSLELADIRAVPSYGRASMLWAGLGGDIERCELLASGLEGVLEVALGLEPDSRRFRPHVTLARARRSRPVSAAALDAASACLRDDARADGRAMSVPSVTLFASTLQPAGPTYRRLGRLPLSGR